MKRSRMAALAVTALAAGLPLVMGNSGAGAAGAGGGTADNVSSSVGAESAESALEYWTPARMKAAVPLDGVATSSVPVDQAAPEKTGPTVSIPGATGSLGGASGADERLIAGAVPRPYTNLPDRTIVKVFFTKATGGNFVCSGTVVNSAGKDLVDTAGHCVADNVSHQFHRNVIVVPAYASGSAAQTTGPYGRWSARTLATKSAWINTTSPQFKLDLGYIVVNKLNNRLIVTVVGGQGSRFNATRSQFFNAFGYPQAAPFNGQSQYRCNSNRLADDNPGGSGPLAIKIRCDMTGGSSGGGWLVSLAANGLGYVNGHNDYKYNNDPNSMYSPYYGPDALNLFNFAESL